MSPEERKNIIDEMRLVNLLENTLYQPTKFRTNSEPFTNEHDKEISKRYISPECYWQFEINIIV